MCTSGVMMMWWLVMMTVTTVMRAACDDAGDVCAYRWREGRRAALCAGGNLTALPALQPDTQELDLAHNHLDRLRGRALSALGLVDLQRLNLTSCRLQTVHPDAFHSLELLAFLDLSHNRLDGVDPRWFAPTPRLRHLRLDGNRIVRLGGRSFPGLGRLRSLLLNGCGLTYVDPAAFVELESSLETLELADNALVELGAGTVGALAALRNLELAGNPWRCGCEVAALGGWLERRHVAWRAQPRCGAGEPWPRAGTAPCLPRQVPADEAVLQCRVVGGGAVRWEAAEGGGVSVLRAGGEVTVRARTHAHVAVHVSVHDTHTTTPPVVTTTGQ